MKAEERHRLHENELHRLTEHARERTRPFFEQYGTTLLLAVAGLLVVIAAIVWYVRRHEAERGAGWSELAAELRKPDQQRSAEGFANIVVNYPGTKAAAWARLYEGESYLSSGIESIFVDKEGALRDLGDARKAFEDVINQKDAPPELTARALHGLARTLETTSDGDLKPAIERYTQLADNYGDTVYAQRAKERIEALKSPEASAFYAWFSKQKPAPKDPIKPPQDRGSAGTTPPAKTETAAPPDGPALTPPAEPSSTAPADDSAPTGSTPASSTPAGGTSESTPPSGSTPPANESSSPAPTGSPAESSSDGTAPPQ